MPAAAIFVNKKEINPSLYDPTKHDPLLAHEATHLQLNAEGWDKLEFEEHADDVVKEKVGAVENWLTDPLINRRIAQRGFNMGPNRNHEVKESIKGLRRRAWSENLRRRKQNSVQAIRLFVSFHLEPDVSKSVKATFRQEFRADVPELFTAASDLLSLIEEKGFSTPEQYRETALLCLQQWQVDVQTVHFTPIQSFSPEDQQAWLAANAPEDTWENDTH